ncbi:MAG: T9SS type A sorting domain-containing protein [Bacteroidales bacterium]|nr:T9SS type A sorting domain-containing protein [Bacteroidales bacterium]
MTTTFTKANIIKRAALILLALVLTCATAWAEDNSSYFTDNGTAPSWDSSFPTSATVAAGEYYEFENVSTYASGSPSPTITLTSADSDDFTFDNDHFRFSTITPGTYAFTFTATNNLGTADVTLTVTVTATTLTGNETSLAAGVYMVNSDITYNSTITLTGDVILILSEGKTMTINSSSHGIDGATNNKNLTIYGETEQDGTLSVTAVGDGICCENITINSGTVNVTSNQSSSISAQNIITINGGVVTATSESTSSINGNWGVSINGGQVTAAGYYGDIVAYNNSNITLGYTNATDFISFESIDVPGTGSVVIADGKVMTDGTNTYDSNTPSATLEALTNTTLRPVTGIANCDITVPNQTLEGPNNPFENICYKFEYANNNYSESYAQEFIAGMGVVVKDGETVLALGTDYLFGSVTYANGEPITESQIGDECKVEIVGQGNYTGSQWASFTIIAPDASGTWGDSNILTWAFHDGTLSITGTGEMKSAANNNDYPWFSIANYVKTLTIGEGITNIAASAFAGTNNVLSYGNLTTVNLPSTLTTIGFEAFAYCIGLNTINNFPENATVAEQAFYLVPCVAAVTVTGYGDSELSEKWVFIASPLSGSITPNAAGNLVGSYNSESGLYDYDLYRFNQSSTTGEWENSVQHNTNANPFVLENGKGYLYASKTTKALIFVGTFNTSADTTIALTYDANAQFAGWNLVGNPFNEEAYVNRPFYKMNDEGTDIEPVENYDNYTAVTIPPCTGIMVQAEGENETVRFSTTQPSMTASNNGHLQIALAEQVTTRGGAISSTIDQAILSFNEDAELGKFYFGSQNAHIYIPQDNEEYAIAFAQKQGEMPLNFKATRHGNYTITVSPAAVEMGYLHLIDHLTGADIDLLQTPSYTFEAKTTDYASRFKLVFAAKDLDTLDDDFAFISNGEIFVNGTGMLQVIDILGHQLLAKQLLTPNSSLLTPHLPTGVYVLRLVNGEQVRTQKIVVR